MAHHHKSNSDFEPVTEEEEDSFSSASSASSPDRSPRKQKQNVITNSISAPSFVGGKLGGMGIGKDLEDLPIYPLSVKMNSHEVEEETKSGKVKKFFKKYFFEDFYFQDQIMKDHQYTYDTLLYHSKRGRPLMCQRPAWRKCPYGCEDTNTPCHWKNGCRMNYDHDNPDVYF